ncbi:MAG: hypothetical protein AAB653_00920 [Patescibacteria group bacterium]
MEKEKYLTLFKTGWLGLLLACVIGVVGCLTKELWIKAFDMVSDFVILKIVNPTAFRVARP